MEDKQSEQQTVGSKRLSLPKKTWERLNIALFNLGASLYDRLTTQDYWKGSVQRLSKNFLTRETHLRILDLGCGAGVSSFALAECYPKAQVVGVDIAAKMIEKARLHHQLNFPHLTQVRFMEGDATSLPFADHSFDIAIGHSFLYLVPQKLNVLREVNRVLKAKGQLVLMEPNAGGSLIRTLLQRSDYLVRAWKRPGDTLRFIASIVAWRMFSVFKGQFSPDFVHQLFTQAGFQNISTLPTLNRLGLYCIGFA